jgi:putative tricarboxylic transport membrane protein
MKLLPATGGGLIGPRKSIGKDGHPMNMDRISGVCLFIFAVFVGFETRVLPLGTHDNPGPGYLPLILASFLAALSLLLIVRGRLSPPWKSIEWPEKYTAWAIIGSCFFAAFCIEPLGYRITIVVVLGFLFGVLERMKIGWTLVLAFGLSWGSFWVFDVLLKVPLPRGGLGI